MKKKNSTLKTTSRIFIIFMLFLSVVSTLGYNLIYNLYQVGRLNGELNGLEKRKEVLLEEEEALNADIKRLSDPLYIARYAREKYLYSKEGEIILRMDE